MVYLNRGMIDIYSSCYIACNSVCEEICDYLESLLRQILLGKWCGCIWLHTKQQGKKNLQKYGKNFLESTLQNEHEFIWNELIWNVLDR